MDFVHVGFARRMWAGTCIGSGRLVHGRGRGCGRAQGRAWGPGALVDPPLAGLVIAGPGVSHRPPLHT